MFGVNLRFRYAFAAAMISSAIAGMFISVNGVLASTIGVGGIPGFLVISEGMTSFLIGMVIVLVLPVILTFVFSKFAKQK